VSALEYVLYGLAVVGLIGLGTGLLVRGRSGPVAPPRTPPRLDRPSDSDVDEPRVGDDAEVPRDTATRTVDVVELPTQYTPTLERPQPPRGRLARLRSRLARSQSSLGRGLLALLSRDRLTEDDWENLEDTLLAADVGVQPTQELVDRLRTRLRVVGSTSGSAGALAVLREELLASVDPGLDRTLKVAGEEGRPGVVLVVGVNGTGKTTTVGRLARMLVAEDKQVLLGAADTFRAAAADQLQTWGERVGVDTVRGAEGSDPASVGFESVRVGVERGVDTVVVDTAGRLHTKSGLMDELGKIRRVIEKQAPVTEVLLVIDATTGQNGLTQARVFSEVVNVTGIVLTKLDGTAKGGIVIAVQRELGVPVKLVGLGEGVDDLAPFEVEDFVDALLAV
jgi:fused signal recognition particle receptor